ncbi:MAG TPA: hypothetical protein IAA77_00740 [Candidatus Avibacteroides excrementipullorum]|jgi:hypothetical protein|nr:hypothetical protein [Candidatus Avibacteroides excrementipullorum]
MKTGFFYGCSLLLAALSLMLTSCKTANKTGGKLMPDAEEATVLASEAAMPHVIVYKTSKDYSRNVPVVLDDSRSVIVSYPAPTDVTPSVFLPVSLDKGYWLDRKGISENTAFLSYTYEEYARMESAPDMDTLLKNIIDYDPMVEIWDCGSRNAFGKGDMTDRLNELINSGFKGCKRVK